MDRNGQMRYSSQRWIPPSASRIAADDDGPPLPALADNVEAYRKRKAQSRNQQPIFRRITRGIGRINRKFSRQKSDPAKVSLAEALQDEKRSDRSLFNFGRSQNSHDRQQTGKQPKEADQPSHQIRQQLHSAYPPFHQSEESLGQTDWPFSHAQRLPDQQLQPSHQPQELCLAQKPAHCNDLFTPPQIKHPPQSPSETRWALSSASSSEGSGSDYYGPPRDLFADERTLRRLLRSSTGTLGTITSRFSPLARGSPTRPLAALPASAGALGSGSPSPRHRPSFQTFSPRASASSYRASTVSQLSRLPPLTPSADSLRTATLRSSATSKLSTGHRQFRPPTAERLSKVLYHRSVTRGRSPGTLPFLPPPSERLPEGSRTNRVLRGRPPEAARSPSPPSERSSKALRRFPPARPPKPLHLCSRKMDSTKLAPEPRASEKKQQAMRDAKDMAIHTRRTCEKLNIPVPAYDFLELIGKGGTGRVYKCKDEKTGNLVAVKIVDTDVVDYQGHVLDRDSTIRDFQKEVATLQKLKEGQAKNINIIHEALEVGTNLWIVSDYCTGGSVRTLMRALPPGQTGLDEQYIIPVARELLVALVALHSLGIIHRDIKCTNVYVTETGALQLGDYGVVGVTDEQTNKRQTVIGTPHWMPRELLHAVDGNQAREAYGKEIDIWSFGCTVYEMATGNPPNARVPMEGLNRALLSTPRLEGGNFSQGLRDFVAFCLNIDPQQRPTADAVLEHPYLANTQKSYPTSALVRLIERYKMWEVGGGVRQSLWMSGGAADIPSQEEPAEFEEEEADDWNFSTSDSFDSAFQRRYSHMLGIGMESLDFALPAPGPGFLPGSGRVPPPIDTSGLSNWEKLQAEWSEQSATRGGESLARLYRLSAAEYKLHTPMTEEEGEEEVDDLPLRSSTRNSEAQESIVDLDEADYDPAAPFNFDFVDATTLKARKSRRMSSQEEEEDDYQYERSDEDNDKRATMEWTFPSTSKKVVSPKRATMDWTFASARAAEPEEPDLKMDLPPPGDGEPPSAFRPTLKHTQTMPLGGAGDYIHPTQSVRPATSPIRDSMASMIDLDMGMVEDSEIERPGTAISTTGSHFSDMTSGNPFDLEEDPNQNELDRNRFSYHKQWQSEGGQVDRNSRRSIPMHTRGSSLSSTDNDVERRSNGLTYQLGPRPYKNGTIDVPDDIDLDSWPTFDQPGIERISSHDSQIMHVRQRSGGSSHAPGVLGSHRMNFPDVVGPNAASLAEDASIETLTAEMERMMGDFAESLRATASALEQHSGLEEEELGVSEGEESAGRSSFEA